MCQVALRLCWAGARALCPSRGVPLSSPLVYPLVAVQSLSCYSECLCVWRGGYVTQSSTGKASERFQRE